MPRCEAEYFLAAQFGASQLNRHVQFGLAVVGWPWQRAPLLNSRQNRGTRTHWPLGPMACGVYQRGEPRRLGLLEQPIDFLRLRSVPSAWSKNFVAVGIAHGMGQPFLGQHQPCDGGWNAGWQRYSRTATRVYATGASQTTALIGAGYWGWYLSLNSGGGIKVNPPAPPCRSIETVT